MKNPINPTGKPNGIKTNGTLPPAVGAKQVASTGGVKPFDPKAFASMQKGIAQDKAYQAGAQARASARAVSAPPKPVVKATPGKPMPIVDRIGSGLRSRRYK